jgi:flagellar basal body rod protein FlgG
MGFKESKMKKISFQFVAMLLVIGLSACGGRHGHDHDVTATAPAPAPVLSFSPSSGAVGSLVTLSGTDFTAASSVSIWGVAAIVVNKSTTDLTAMVMPGAISGSVNYTTATGTTAITGTFTVSATGVPVTQQGNKLVATDGQGSAWQGYSVAVSADGNTAVVGGANDNSYVGAAYVYTRSGGVWTQQGTKLFASDAVSTALQGALQGSSVALSADGNTAVVGGSGDNGKIGAAWVYIRSGGVWTQQGSKLIASDAAGSAQQGTSVAVSADGNTVVVGGQGDNNNVGAAWVYARSNGVWAQQGSKLFASDAAGSAQQGYSVALSADGNTVVVGGYYDNSGAGAAWVYALINGVWTPQGSKLVATDATSFAYQGWSVALSADGNTAVVGGLVDGSTYAGAAYVYTRSGGVWAQQGSKLVGTGAVGASYQGSSVAVSADGNTAVVGGYGDNSNVGAAWVYTRSSGIWTQQGSKFVGTGATGASWQGSSVALSADGNTTVVGGSHDSSSVGAAWIYTP